MIKFQRRDLAVFIINSSAILITLYFSYIYLNYLPVIKSDIFVTLIQVISAILGFTLVVFSYFLIKIDEYKKEYLTLVSALPYEQIRSQSETVDRLTKIADDTVNKTNLEDIEKILSNASSIKNGVESVSKILDSVVEELLKDFESITSLLRKDIFVILTSFSLGIFISFWGLFIVVQSNPVKYGAWTTLIIAGITTISTIDHFNSIWKDWQQALDKLYRVYLLSSITSQKYKGS